MAGRSPKKNRKITIHISDTDIHHLKCMAANEGIPYQTLITSILHKAASGAL